MDMSAIMQFIEGFVGGREMGQKGKSKREMEKLFKEAIAGGGYERGFTMGPGGVGMTLKKEAPRKYPHTREEWFEAEEEKRKGKRPTERQLWKDAQDEALKRSGGTSWMGLEPAIRDEYVSLARELYGGYAKKYDYGEEPPEMSEAEKMRQMVEGMPEEQREELKNADPELYDLIFPEGAEVKPSEEPKVIAERVSAEFPGAGVEAAVAPTTPSYGEIRPSVPGYGRAAGPMAAFGKGIMGGQQTLGRGITDILQNPEFQQMLKRMQRYIPR